MKQNQNKLINEKKMKNKKTTSSITTYKHVNLKRSYHKSIKPNQLTN